ncbi:MAG TPA: hypothetical protein PLB16_11965, partial [bacterium]|nr:hypothetical protein [bacterium]
YANGDKEGFTKSILGATVASHEGKHLDIEGKERSEERAAYSLQTEVYDSLKSQFKSVMNVSTDLNFPEFADLDFPLFLL